jgi:hypothetical protein
MAGGSLGNALVPARPGISAAESESPVTAVIAKGQGDLVRRRRRINKFTAERRHFSVIR